MENRKDEWEQYQDLRIERIQQQRQRMQNMKDVIEQYMQIIRKLQTRINHLEEENANNAEYKIMYNEILCENKDLVQNYQWINEQIQKQRQRRQDKQEECESLKMQIDNQVKNNYQIQQNQQLYFAYEHLKEQLYSLEKQNIELREVIKDQSKLYYQQHQKYQRLERQRKVQLRYEREKNTKEPGKISQLIKENHYPPLEHKEKKRIISMNYDNKSVYTPDKVQILKSQLKKQEKLILKYQKTEEQHNELIQLLKIQKRCPCHVEGKSKKLVSQKTINHC